MWPSWAIWITRARRAVSSPFGRASIGALRRMWRSLAARVSPLALRCCFRSSLGRVPWSDLGLALLLITLPLLLEMLLLAGMVVLGGRALRVI